MPPKKKLKLSSPSAKTQAVAAGEDTPMAVSNIKDVNEFQLLMEKWIDTVHNLRHHTGPCTAAPPVKPSEVLPGQYEWPVCEGGTLKDIAQRAWADPDRLFTGSAKMLHAAGLLPSDDVQHMLSEFCQLPEPCPAKAHIRFTFHHVVTVVIALALSS